MHGKFEFDIRCKIAVASTHFHTETQPEWNSEILFSVNLIGVAFHRMANYSVIEKYGRRTAKGELRHLDNTRDYNQQRN